MLSPASRALATIKAGKRCKAHGVLMLAAVARMKTRRLWHAVAPGQDGGMVVVVVLCGGQERPMVVTVRLGWCDCWCCCRCCCCCSWGVVVGKLVGAERGKWWRPLLGG